MRIRGCSADVCSSDLGRPGAASVRSGLLVPRLLGQGPREGLPPGAPRGGYTGMSETLLSVCELKVHFEVRVGGVFAGRYLPLKAVDGVSFELKAGETLGIRSEEHTSELQSLMRISYAVFCLKKKKTKANETRH